LTTKQQEAQSMAEALELCRNTVTADAAAGSLPEVGLIDASANWCSSRGDQTLFDFY
jgi:hypothetical protein